MKILLFTIILLAQVTFCHSKEYKIEMSLNDTFIIADSDTYQVNMKKKLTLRFAEVQILPKLDNSFNLMLYFKADTADLAQFDTPNKMKESVILSSEKYLPHAVEEKILLKELHPTNQYGFLTVLTDKELMSLKNIPENQFVYMTRGMVRLSKDSALGFSLMTNEVNTFKYGELVSFIQSFVK